MKNDMELLELGRDVLNKEGRALRRLANKLDQSFLEAVKLIMAPGRRVAVTGMGKSGHIGRKIAATFSSTGTPAYFIHPAEACHGDLGMLGARDALLAISNSGSTQELIPTLLFCQRHGLPIIALTHGRESTLGKIATIVLHLDFESEACPLGCAPTTSTTAALAMGDALAMALLQARGFSEKDFNEFHPGGALGLKLQLVEEIMRTGDALPLVRENACSAAVLLEMTLKSLGCAGVTDGSGDLVGIITDGDIRRHAQDDFSNLVARDLMTCAPVCVSRETSVAKAIGQMNSRGITTLMVLENSKPVGIVHMHDCLRQEI